MPGNPEPSFNAAEPVIVYVVDLACLQCGRCIGVLESLRWPDTGIIQFRRDAVSAPVIVTDRRRLRCPACAGNAYGDHVATRRIYALVSRDELDLTRRGRPPKWLAEQRRAQRAAENCESD